PLHRGAAVIASAAARLAASPRRRAAILGIALLAAVLLALSPGAVAPAAARAALAAAAIAAAAVLARRGARRGAVRAPLTVLAREPLTGGAGLALVETGSRRLLVGFGRDGVRLVADLGAASGEQP
ncbi:MAG TPA: flagellar biosynthetic protein FliO, partial [Anaeromyxobacter sp.]